MRTIHSDQHGVPCLVLAHEDFTRHTLDAIVQIAVESQALCHSDEREWLVVQLPGRAIEFYTERDFRQRVQEEYLDDVGQDEPLGCWPEYGDPEFERDLEEFMGR